MLIDCDFRGANLFRADFSGALVLRCHFGGASLTGAVVERARFVGCDFAGADLPDGLRARRAQGQNREQGHASRMVAEIRGALDAYPREQLQEILA